MKKTTEQEFKERVKSISNDTIDVSDFNFENTQTKGKCRCKICGYEWETRAYSILQGHGCRKCYDKRNAISKAFSVEEVQRKITENGSNTKIIGEYVDTKHKCKAQCVECGYIWHPNVMDLMGGHGCPICGRKKIGLRKRLSEEEYKNRCYEKYGDKYDLSELRFISLKDDVYPICPNHGQFEVNAEKFLKGKGCSKCKEKVKQNENVNIFIKRADEIHQNKYDYTKIEYINKATKICIICPIHGEFYQTPKMHLKGHGCPICGGSAPLSIKTFIERAKEVHDNKYDYSKVEYANSHTKVCIICPEHGEFWQAPDSHLRGQGCPKCAYQTRRIKNSSSTKDFIDKGVIIHDGKYDYSKVEYVNNRTKVCIVCPIHGEFYQTPNDHLDGSGCPKCNASHMEDEIGKFLTEHGVLFDVQKKYEWLGAQSLDFYLPEHNIAIECQGIQHFEVVDHFGGDNAYQYRLERDERKRQLCEEHGIKILYYANYDYDFPYEVITDKEKLYNEICNPKQNVV